MSKMMSFILFAALLFWGCDFALGAPQSFALNNVPDFSQHEVPGWSNYCARLLAPTWLTTFRRHTRRCAKISPCHRRRDKAN